MRTDPFVFHNGRQAHTIAELAQIVAQSTAGLFHEHVTHERNDFASWIELSLHEADLAKHTRLAKTREELLETLHTWLSPRKAHQHVLDATHQKEFLLGLAVGIIVGVILLRMIEVLV